MKAFMTIKELTDKLNKKEITPTEVQNYYHARIKKYHTKLNCFLEVFDKDEQNTGSQAQNTNNNSENTGILAHIPYVYKDNICLKDKITSANSKILSNYKAPYDATVHKRLKQAGATPIARTNCDEFAMGTSGEFSACGPTLNPWDHERTPGGSSSGSTAAVAAGLIPFSLGSETGGSIRTPVSFSGLVGMYPTYGLNSRYGLIAFGSSLDQIAPITHTVYDNALVATALSGKDPKDSTSIQMDPKDYTKNLTGRLPENLTIGIIKDCVDNKSIHPEVSQAFEQAIEQLHKLGAKTKVIEIPHLKYGNAVYFIITRAEAASNLSRFDGTLYGNRAKDCKDLESMYNQTRHDGFGIEVKRRILTGNYVLGAKHQENFYARALKVRDMIRAEFLDAFKDVDLLMSPTTPTPAFKIGELIDDPITMYLADFFTVPNCVIGTPALSLPCGFTKTELPIGFQFFGPPLSEELIYQTAHAYQVNTDHHTKHPKNYD
ncbi:MAG: Asp-tRNA(Asn)/Glu-tRNA(Gln) amidotransferase subunit GatA [bacterium]